MQLLQGTELQLQQGQMSASPMDPASAPALAKLVPKLARPCHAPTICQTLASGALNNI